MEDIINLIFDNQIKNIKSILLKNKLKLIKANVLQQFDDYKHSGKFLDDILKMYDKEQLCDIRKLINKEIQRKTLEELNNF